MPSLAWRSACAFLRLSENLRALFFPRSDLGASPPAALKGTPKVKRHPSKAVLHYPVSTPARCRPRKRYGWGTKAKPLAAAHVLAALLFVDAAPHIWRTTLQNVMAVTDGRLPVLANFSPLSRGPEGYSPITSKLGLLPSLCPLNLKGSRANPSRAFLYLFRRFPSRGNSTQQKAMRLFVIISADVVTVLPSTLAWNSKCLRGKN